MKRIVTYLLLGILVITLPGYHFAYIVQNNPDNLVGKWGREGGFKLVWEIRTDNTYTISREGQFSIEGKYVKEGNKITLYDISSNDVVPCTNQAGLYTYAIKGQNLTLTKVTDDCNGRSTNFPGIFKREK